MANYRAVLGIPPKPGKVRKVRPSPSHLRAVKQEKETAKRLRGRLTPASGAKDEKGDVRVKRIARVECKTTKHKSFSVTLETVRAIEEAALSGGEVPILLVEFNDNMGKSLGEVAIIPSYLLDEFIDRELP